MAELFYLSIIGALLSVGPALAAISIRRSLAIPYQLLLLGVCILYGVFPLLLALAGAALAEPFGCTVEITIYKCQNHPGLGDLITVMTFAHWAAFLTIPSGVLGVFGFMISLILKLTASKTGAVTKPTPAFVRDQRRKAIAGVCAALAQRWKLPILGIRIAAVGLAIIAPVVGLAYLWLWIAFPLEVSTRDT